LLFPITSTHTTQVQVKALTEELENPLNVHRWRRLEGTDPQAYEMIIKIQTLQKKLTQKTEEVNKQAHTHNTTSVPSFISGRGSRRDQQICWDRATFCICINSS
jgi:hypothetical protein